MTNTHLEQHYDDLGEHVMQTIREADGRHMSMATLQERFASEGVGLPFVLGMLWAGARVELRPKLGGEWNDIDVTVGQAEVLHYAHAEPEWAGPMRRECPQAGQVGHWGCGVCVHGRVYAACMPCFTKRVRGEL